MTKIEVYGYGLSFGLTEIAPALAKQLTDEDESGITWGLEIHVDGQK